MDLTSKRIIKNLLKKYQVQPSKKFGQNFLVDKTALKKIIETAELKPDDIVLEIGPGLGVLTLELAKKVKKVIGLEKDPRMCQILKELLENWNIRNVKIINADILKIENWKLTENCKLEIGNYKIVANLPYYITAPVIRKFLESTRGRPRRMVLVVQKEVAQRICAKPPKMSILAVSVQFYAKPEIISYVSKKSFWPSPKVDSAIIKIVSRQFHVSVSHLFRERFFRIVRAGFSQPRKQILNNLSKMLKLDKEKAKSWLLKNNIQPEKRAETLTVKDWILLTKNF